MGNFYTQVSVDSNNILYRGVTDSGKRVQERLPYKPKLYMLSDIPGRKWKTLDGRGLTEKKFNSIKEAREYCNRFKFDESFPIYGMQRYQYAFISDAYQQDIEYDPTRIKIAYIDIEVDSSIGFPKVEEAKNEITAITVRLGDRYHIFARGAFVSDRKDIHYHFCTSEQDLIERFLTVWESDYPDVISGWYSNGFDIPYLINRITNVFNRQQAERLSPWGMLKAKRSMNGDEETHQYEIVGINCLDYLELYKKQWNPNHAQESYKLDNIAEVELDDHKVDFREMGYATLDALYRDNHQLYIEYNLKDVELVYGFEKKLKLIELVMVLAYMTKVNMEDVMSQGRMWDCIIFNYLRKDHIAIPPIKPGAKGEQYKGGYVRPPVPGRYYSVVSFDFTSLYPHIMMGWNISPDTIIEPTYEATQSATLVEWWRQVKKDVDVDNLLDKKVNMDYTNGDEDTLCDIPNLLKVAVAPNKQLFNTSKEGFLPRILNHMFEERKKYKKLQLQRQKDLLEQPGDKKIKDEISRYKAMQMALKVTLNSAYGSLGSAYFRYFDTRVAEAVTLFGQLAIRWMEKHLNAFLNKRFGTQDVNYIIGADTDSLYVWLDKYEHLKGVTGNKLADLMDSICEDELAPVIADFCKEVTSYTGARENKLHMKRESLIEQGIWMAKKNYIASILDDEGVRYAKPKVKVTGWIGIKSVIPKSCQDVLYDAVEIILYQGVKELRTHVADFKKKFWSMATQKIGAPQGISDMLEKYGNSQTIYESGTPQAIKAALVYNWYLKEKGLEKKYESIKSNSKIKYVLLKDPNPIGQDVIGFIDVLPPEFGLDKYIDREGQFTKLILSPLDKILSKIGWSMTQTSSLGRFTKKQ